MAWRFRAHLRYTAQSGFGVWGSQQMAQRLAMAFHMNEGDPNEERSHVTVRPDGTLDIDCFWPADRHDLAVDTQSTFVATGGFMRPDGDDDTSWMDTHQCAHADGEPCPTPTWRWTLANGVA